MLGEQGLSEGCTAFGIRNCEFLSIFFHFYFFNSNISITIYAIEIKNCVCIPNILLEGSVSQTFDLCPSYDFMSKIG